MRLSGREYRYSRRSWWYSWRGGGGGDARPRYSRRPWGYKYIVVLSGE